MDCQELSASKCMHMVMHACMPLAHLAVNMSKRQSVYVAGTKSMRLSRSAGMWQETLKSSSCLKRP